MYQYVKYSQLVWNRSLSFILKVLLWCTREAAFWCVICQHFCFSLHVFSLKSPFIFPGWIYRKEDDLFFFFFLLEGELDLQTPLRGSFEHSAITKREELVCGHRPFETKWQAMGLTLCGALSELELACLELSCAHRLLQSDVQNLRSHAVTQTVKMTKINVLSWSVAGCVQGVASCHHLAMLERDTLS